ncbi:hypothetical protein HMPREF3226_01396 [Prevotella corporis]|uniref:Uncharacterized protein n=1 Tax=Prevotella corporis TaxID=28128 RepID=A0A133Q9K8_9BACT|nr:hypothetical protein HMPREF3226_01396 [Prevotella corporis]
MFKKTFVKARHINESFVIYRCSMINISSLTFFILITLQWLRTFRSFAIDKQSIYQSWKN